MTPPVSLGPDDLILTPGDTVPFRGILMNEENYREGSLYREKYLNLKLMYQPCLDTKFDVSVTPQTKTVVLLMILSLLAGGWAGAVFHH